MSEGADGRAGALALVASLAGIGLGLWVAFAPWPETVAIPIAAAAPVVSLVVAAVSRGQLSLGVVSAFNRRPGMGGLTFAPMIGLAFYAFHGAWLYYWTTPVWIAVGSAAVVACGVAFVVGAIDPGEMGDQLMLVLSGLAAFAWVAAMIVAVNKEAPARASIAAPGAISEKHHYRGRRSETWEITVQTRDGRFEEAFPVSSSLYDQLSIGDSECIVRTEGWLRIWWRDFEACPTQGARALTFAPPHAPFRAS